MRLADGLDIPRACTRMRAHGPPFGSVRGMGGVRRSPFPHWAHLGLLLIILVFRTIPVCYFRFCTVLFISYARLFISWMIEASTRVRLSDCRALCGSITLIHTRLFFARVLTGCTVYIYTLCESAAGAMGDGDTPPCITPQPDTSTPWAYPSAGSTLPYNLYTVEGMPRSHR